MRVLIVEDEAYLAEAIRDAGLGLGLAIVKSIALAHDGTLTLAPRAGGGLLVTVRLPGAPQALAVSGAR